MDKLEAREARLQSLRLQGDHNTCPWCDCRDHWSGQLQGCPSRAAQMAMRAINTLIEPGEGWQEYALRLRKQLTDEAERVA